MVLHQHKRAVGIFTSREAVNEALRELKRAKFPLHRVSVIARELEEKPIRGVSNRTDVGNRAGDGAASGAVTGSVIGLITGLLVGIGALAIPLIGPIMLADALSTAVATTLAGGGIGLVSGGLIGTLIGLGIPKKQAKVYQERLLRGDYLVIVEGTDDQIRYATSILKHWGIEEWGIYKAPDLDSTDTDFPLAAVEDPHVRTSRQSVYQHH
ncbi:MAG: general stress protein, partial [Cyanobacteriota bacterium]